MVFVKSKATIANICLMSISPVLAMVATVKRSAIILLLVVFSIFITVGRLPFSKKHENLWVFLLASISGMPINLHLVVGAVNAGLLASDMRILAVVRATVLYMVLFSIEQLVLGYIARRIWRKQYSIKVDK